MLIQIRAPHFTAGIVLTSGRVTRAAPIVAYMMNWNEAQVCAYVAKKRWTVETVADSHAENSATSTQRDTPVLMVAKSKSATSK